MAKLKFKETVPPPPYTEKKIPGQMTLFDYWLENHSYGAYCRSLGFTNAYDKMPDHPCTVTVIDHNDNIFDTEAVLSFGTIVFKGGSKGYDICWWKEKT